MTSISLATTIVLALCQIGPSWFLCSLPQTPVLALATTLLPCLQVPLLALGSVDLRDGVGKALQILMLFGFLVGVVMIINGGMAIRRGEDGKLSIVGGIIVAAAPTIMYALFDIFGLGDVAPKF